MIVAMDSSRNIPFLPVCRPQLPPAQAVARYLEQADAARHYTNRGPLVQRLEQRLAETLNLPGHAVRTASTGTTAIEIAVLATAGPAQPERPFALLPSFTFAATALAVERLGYRPLFTDVDPLTWAMDLAAVRHHPQLDRVGVIVSVAPFGRRPDLSRAEDLHQQTGIPVVIDAAASFESVLDSAPHVSVTVPVTLSFHATKTFSTGEGGAVLWDNPAGADVLVRAANFGFNFSRRSESAGTNAKMSEIHAAVGHAMLDSFGQRRRDYATTTALWRQKLRALPGISHVSPDLASVYIMWEAPSAADLSRAQDALTAANIDSRLWYEKGLHDMPHFRADSLTGSGFPVTEDLGSRLLGLPMAHDLGGSDMDRVVSTILTALA